VLDAREQLEVLAGRELRPQGIVLWAEPQALPAFVSLGRDIVAVHLGLPLCEATP
jgi:hypothetical protein